MPEIRVACSPDADDLFMMRALLEGEIDTSPWTFRITTAPTDRLNELGHDEAPEVLAISVAHYPHLASRYQLLPHGGSMGEGYGPVLVARAPTTLDALRGKKVGVPGLNTTAWSVLKMMIDVDPVVIPISPYEAIFDALQAGTIDAALLIHEGRLLYEQAGLHLIADIGVWWAETTDGLPLPLGGNSIRRDLGADAIAAISRHLRASIAHALTHRDDSIAWLLERSVALSTAEEVSTYLDMYANGRTLDYGPDGRAAIQAFLDRLAASGQAPQVSVDFAP